MEEKKKISATDRLANERTFLAWVRTALGIVALGFVIVKFSLFLTQVRLIAGNYNIPPGHIHYHQPLANTTGVILMIFGLMLLVLSYTRFLRTEKQLTEGNLAGNRLLPLITTLALGLVIVLLIVYMVV